MSESKKLSQPEKARVVKAIRSIAQELRPSGRAAASSRVTGAQLDVLRALLAGPADSVNDLAERTFTHQSSVSMIVGRLADAGLVSRTPSKTDGRRLAVSLTNAGRAVLRKSSESSEDRLLAALEGMNREDLADVARLLEKLTTFLAAQAKVEPTGSDRKRGCID